MAAEMTKAWLLNHCKERGQYQTPYLNEHLYLQCQAFCNIENLEDYTGVKVLYLEENCLESIDGIQCLKQLQCFHNYLRNLENLSKCCNLRVLVVSSNHLDSIKSIEHLTNCPSIVILDLSHNQLKDGDGVLRIVASMPKLAVLYLRGNPCVSTLPHYRKATISKLGKLTHLDERPVFWDERLCAEAWSRGDQDAENAERARVREITAEEERKQFIFMRQLREESMEERFHVKRPTPVEFDAFELGEVEFQVPEHEQEVDENLLLQDEEVSGFSIHHDLKDGTAEFLENQPRMQLELTQAASEGPAVRTELMSDSVASCQPITRS